MASGIIISLLLLLANTAVCNVLKFYYEPLNVKVGDSLKLICFADTNSLIVNWNIKRDGVLLLNTDPNIKYQDPSVSHWKYSTVQSSTTDSLVVEISSLACIDNGSFVCIGLTKDVEHESTPLDMFVKAPPQKVEIRSNFVVLADKELEFTVGKQIHLICDSLVGNPPGNVNWFITNDVSKPESFRVITDNVSSLEPKAVRSSCQTNKKISLKYFPNREMRVAIKCSVNNTVGEQSFMRIFNIVKKEEKDSSKLIIIVVLCVIIPEIIIAIILGVVLYIRRSRAKKKREMEAAEAMMGSYKPAEEKALSEREYSNSMPMKNIKSSVGGRRNRDSHNDNDQEKQAMTGAAKA